MLVRDELEYIAAAINDADFNRNRQTMRVLLNAINAVSLGYNISVNMDGIVVVEEVPVE